MPSTTLNISLPMPLKRFVEKQTASEGYTSASEYIRELIRAARRRQAHQLETLLLEGIESGSCIQVDDAYWTAKEEGLLDRWAELGDE